MMKRTTVAVLAVAILGLMAFYKDHSSAAVGGLSAPSGNATGKVSAVGGSAQPATGGYKDGTFTGSTAYIPYGPVQIAVVIGSGKITDVKFLQMPSAQGYSRQVAAAAEPLLKQTTLQAQSANIQFVSGATATSTGYQESLQSALDQAAGGSSSGQNTTVPSGSSGSTTNSPGFQPSGLPAGGDD